MQKNKKYLFSDLLETSACVDTLQIAYCLFSAAKLGRRSRKMRDLIRSIEDKQTEQALHGLLSLNSDQESRQLIDSLDSNEVNLNRQEINHLSVAALQMLLKQRAECGPNYPRQRRMHTPPRQESPLMDGIPHGHHNQVDSDQPLDLSDESNPSNNHQDPQHAAIRPSLPLNLITTASRAHMMNTYLNMQSQLPFHLPHSPLAIKTEDGHTDGRRSPYLPMFDPASYVTSRSSPSVLASQSLMAQQFAVQQHLARQLITQHQLVTSALCQTNPVLSTASGKISASLDDEREDEEASESSETSSNTSKSVIVQHTSLDLRKVVKEEENVKHSRSPIKKRPYVPSTSSDRDGDPEVVYKHSRLSADSSSSSRTYSPERRPGSAEQSPCSSPYPPSYVPVTSSHLPDFRVTQPLRIETFSHRHSIDESSGPRPLSSPSYSHANSEFQQTGSEYRGGRLKGSGSQSDHHTAVVAPIIQNQYPLSREDEARLTVPLLTYKIHESFDTTFTHLKRRLEEMHIKLRSYQGSESMDGMINRLLSEHMDKSNNFQVRFSHIIVQH